MIEDKMIEKISRHSKTSIKYFYSYGVPKKKGGARIVHAYKDKRMKEKHQEINKKLTAKLKEVDVYYYSVAFSGFDLVESAKRHKDNDYFFNFDFTGFFNSINISQLFNQYSQEELGLSDDEVISIIKGTNEGFLLQGNVLSPVIANLIMVRVDNEIARKIDVIMKKYKYDKGVRKPVYTRYADDITISYPEGFWDSGVFLDNNGKVKKFKSYKKYLYSSKRKQYEKELSYLIEDTVAEVLKLPYHRLLCKPIVSLNPKKTRSCNLNEAGHYKLLSWNIVKGKDGQPNYITAGRNRCDKGYYGYQEHTFAKKEAKKNTRKINLKYLEGTRDTNAMIKYYTSHHTHDKSHVLKMHMLLTIKCENIILHQTYLKTIECNSSNYTLTYLKNLLNDYGIEVFFEMMNILNMYDREEYSQLTGGDYNEFTKQKNRNDVK